MIYNLQRRGGHQWEHSVRIWKGLTSYFHFMKLIKWNCGPKTIDFQESSKIRVSCFFRQIKLPKKEFWIQANISESNFTFLAKTVWNQTKVFLGALARQNFVAPTRPNWFSVKVKVEGICTTADIFKFKTNFCTSILCFFFTKQRTEHIYSQKDESFLQPLRNTFTRCLTLIPSDKFWRNFLHFDTKELWTQNNRFPRVVQNSRELLLSTD